SIDTCLLSQGAHRVFLQTRAVPDCLQCLLVPRIVEAILPRRCTLIARFFDALQAPTAGSGSDVRSVGWRRSPAGRRSTWALALTPDSPAPARVTFLRAAFAPAPHDLRDHRDC